jgi:16S rRNA G966 N2-methylase RsmD
LNEALLHKEVQQFINDHLKSDLSKLILKGTPFKDVKIQELAAQIQSKSKSRDKLPTWFHTNSIYYPKSLSIEQTSSELTAQYKASLIEGDQLIDLTGGFGVDSYFFAKKFNSVIHCEIDTELSKIVRHNFIQLELKNITSFNTNGIDELSKNETFFDWIYIDPSRRDALKTKVFKLEDCLPDVGKHLDVFLERSDNVMIKLSPLLDISLTIKDLKFVKEIHVVAVKNEVKELLILIQKGYEGPSKIKTINIVASGQQTFEGYFPSNADVEFSAPKKYLYEPNAALLKSGLFNEVSSELNAPKLHSNSHLYTSDELLDFPGRRFTILSVFKYNKKLLKRNFKPRSANITTRNFHDSVAEIRKKTGIKEGGSDYLFFTTDIEDNSIVIHCKKV